MSHSDISNGETSFKANSNSGQLQLGATTGGGTSGGNNDSPFVTTGMSREKADPEPLIKNIWTYIFSYTDHPPPIYQPKPMLALLREALIILQAEPTVIDLTGLVTIIGGVHGHGDSLLAHLTHNLMPPTTTYVFLGNYIGQGFASHESLFLLLAMKVKFPKHVYLLKGSFEDPHVLKGQEFIAGLHKRELMSDVLIWCLIEQIMQAFPLAAVLNESYLCIPGGIGPELMKRGLKELRKVERPPVLASHITMTLESQWACMKLPGDDEFQNDGSPTFTEAMVAQFCKENKLRMIIRSRQIVVEGILNYPEQMLTLWTPVSFLDSFRNLSASLRLNGDNHKASITRYRTQDEEPKSLDEIKPPAGRNAIVL